MMMLRRRGATSDPSGTPFLRCCNICCCRYNGEAAITNQMIKQTMHLSGSKRSNLQVQAALTAVTDIIKSLFGSESSIVSSQ